MPKSKKQKKEKDEICPVCGYYCLGKGGMGCIDKPSTLRMTHTHSQDWEKEVDEKFPGNRYHELLEKHKIMSFISNFLEQRDREINPPIETEFVECDTCKIKPGSPVLCNGCLKNRQIIHTLVKYINNKDNNHDK